MSDMFHTEWAEQAAALDRAVSQQQALQSTQGLSWGARLKEFFTDLAKVQSELDGAKRDKKNSHFNSKYATLEAVWEAWSEVGPKYGFSIIQLVRDAGDRQGILLQTTLCHKSGEHLSSIAFFPALKNDPQAYGSALTYARRYMLSAMVGICPEDDDGEAAVGRGNGQQSAQDAFKRLFEQAWGKAQGDSEKLSWLKSEAKKHGCPELAEKAGQALEVLKGKDK